MLSKVARIAKAASRITCSTPSAKAINVALARPVQLFTSRQFSSADEPEYVVDPEALVDINKVKVTYIKDREKQQIYARFRSDPTKWDIKALSNFYSMSEERVQAIIYLMHSRFTMMEKKGLKINIISNEENVDESMNVEALIAAGEEITLPGPKVVVEIPEIWRLLYSLHKEDSSKDLGALLEGYNQNQPDEALKAHISVDEVKKIFEELKDHEARLENIRAYEEHIENFLAELAEEGVNINFQEIKVVSDKARKFEKTYFPRTLHDEEIEKEKEFLLKRIEQQTRATVERNVEFYHDQFHGKDFKGITTDKDSSKKTLRWKLAFRDLDKVNEIRSSLKDKSQIVDAPTLIRTRSGK